MVLIIVLFLFVLWLWAVKVDIEKFIHGNHFVCAFPIKFHGCSANSIIRFLTHGNLQYTTFVLSRCNGRLAASLNSLYSRFSMRIFALAAVASLAASSVPRASIAI